MTEEHVIERPQIFADILGYSNRASAPGLLRTKVKTLLTAPAVLYPRISLLPAHLPYTLAQRGVLRLEDTIYIIEGLSQILNDDRFTKSSYTEHRDAAKTKKHDAALSGLRGSIVEAVKQLDFEGVFLEEKSWQSNFRKLSMQANKESDK